MSSKRVVRARLVSKPLLPSRRKVGRTMQRRGTRRVGQEHEGERERELTMLNVFSNPIPKNILAST